MKVARRVSCMALLSALAIGTAWNRTLIGTDYRLTIALIAAVGSFCAFATAQTGGTGVVLTPAEMQWTTQGGLAAPGMEQLNLVGDPAKPGPYTLRLKFPKGFRIAPHTHPDSREVTILSGIFATGYGEKFDAANLKVLPPGSFSTEPANIPHYIEIEEDTVPAGERHGSKRTQICQSARRFEIARRRDSGRVSRTRPVRTSSKKDVKIQAPSSPLAQIQPVKIRRRLREQRGLLSFAVWRGDTFEGVEDDLIAALALVRRKIALKHAAVGTEGLDAGLDIGPPRRGGLLRRGRHRPLVKIITKQAHRQPPKLHNHIGTFRDFLDRSPPLPKSLLAPVGKAAAANRAAAMIEHDPRVRKGAGEIGEFADLRVK